MLRTTIATCMLLGTLTAPVAAETITEAARAIEADLGGRVGVSLRQPGGAGATGYREDERFPCPAPSRRPCAARS